MRVPALAVLSLLLMAGCSSDPKAQSVEEDIDFGAVSATETTGLIRGIVVDLAIRPLEGALVTLPVQGANRTATTGPDGQFAFSGLPPGTYFLTAAMQDHTTVQQSVEVVAGDSAPPVVKIALERLPSTLPYLEAISKSGFITFGAAVGITSLGSTFLGGIGEDDAIWNVAFTQVPTWAQGELVWQQTQPAGGMLIWEMVKGGTNEWHGHRETKESPALAYWTTADLLNQSANVTDVGIDYRFFGGPHPALAPNSAGGPFPPEEQCPVTPVPVLGAPRNPCRFGFGLTMQQRAEGYIHNFYNFAPPEGWRYTVDGDPVVPAA